MFTSSDALATSNNKLFVTRRSFLLALCSVRPSMTPYSELPRPGSANSVCFTQRRVISAFFVFPFLSLDNSSLSFLFKQVKHKMS